MFHHSSVEARDKGSPLAKWGHPLLPPYCLEDETQVMSTEIMSVQRVLVELKSGKDQEGFYEMAGVFLSPNLLSNSCP